MRSLAVLAVSAACGRIAFDPLADTGAADANASDTMSGPLNRAFVTSQTFSVPWIGYTEAALRCQLAADDAGIDGRFLALLGDEAVGPIARPPIANARGWVDLSGNVLADTPAEWLDGRMRRPLYIDEHRMPTVTSLIWLGAVQGSTCDGWNTPSAPTPSIARTTSRFASNERTVDCTSALRYACIEYMRTTPVTEAPQPGRIAFVTTTTWVPGGGVASADAICASDATSNGLAGSFKALLTTSIQSGVARFLLTGARWIRVDGLPFVESASELASRPVFASFLLRVDGTPTDNLTTAWSWTGSAAANCSDWLSANPGMAGVAGNSASADRTSFLGQQTYSCNEARPLVCLQE